jgi:hypothetical protein
MLVLKEIATAVSLKNMHFGKRPVLKIVFHFKKKFNKSMRSANGCIWRADIRC